MAQETISRIIVHACGVAALLVSGFGARADDNADTQSKTLSALRQLQQQNDALQEQLRKQQALIESLTKTVQDLQAADARRGGQIDALKSELKDTASLPGASTSFSPDKISIGAEGGLGFFNSGSKGFSPNAEFRVDEARLFVEAPIFDQVYFFSEIDLLTREAENLELELGELYLDFENVSRIWNRDRMLNIRAGRMFTPFGEEYLARFAIDNPLISHSLPDIWAVDEGIEFYGNVDQFSYALAVQSGGPSGIRDFTADKSLAGRISWDPASWLHLSASGMRTGDLRAPQDYWSALWFGNGWFLPIGSKKTTTYHADLFEGDIEVRLPHGHIKAFGGYARYEDNDPLGNNSRDLFYYSAEVVHQLYGKLYGALRYSQILVDNGFPLAGNGDPGRYVFSGVLTDNLLRFSAGLGYRWSPNLIFKTEYSYEWGTTTTGEKRNHEDLFAIEAAFKF